MQHQAGLCTGKTGRRPTKNSIADWLFSLDEDISQRKPFFIAVLCPSQALLCICLLSPLELNAFMII